MTDRIEQLKSKLLQAKSSWIFVWETIEKALEAYPDMPYLPKHYLFQCQVFLDSNQKLIEKYQETISRFKESSLSDKEYEYTDQVLNNLITDHQAKSISIDNILKNYL